MLLRHEKRRTLSSNGRFRISSYLVVYFDVGNLTIKLKVYETPASKIEMTVYFQSQYFSLAFKNIFHPRSSYLICSDVQQNRNILHCIEL